jgi:hypothetical protein
MKPNGKDTPDQFVCVTFKKSINVKWLIMHLSIDKERWNESSAVTGASRAYIRPHFDYHVSCFHARPWMHFTHSSISIFQREVFLHRPSPDDRCLFLHCPSFMIVPLMGFGDSNPVTAAHLSPGSHLSACEDCVLKLAYFHGIHLLEVFQQFLRIIF